MALFESDFPVRMVSTMLRSGTWYHHYLLGTYDRLVGGGPDASPVAQSAFHSYAGLRLNIAIVHMKCPDFADVYDGPLRPLWNDTVTVIGDPHRDVLAGNPGMFSFRGNPNLRVAYVFRNPLDQCVSAWRHLQNHIEPWRRSLAHQVPLSEWIRRTWTNIYIHQYFTFHVMQAQLPGSILMLPYEYVLEDRRRAFLELLAFFGLQPDMDNVERALALTTKERLRDVEREQGHSLAGDQISGEQSHIRDGSVGKWRECMSADDVDFISRRFAEFGLDLNSFRLEQT